MGPDSAPCVLDDIAHVISPSPPPQGLADDSKSLLRTESSSPEPLQGSQILQMRRRVTGMNTSRCDPHSDAQQKELVDMVLRLTSSPIPDTEQLIRQADMISALTAHRDLLLHQAEEQHLRWHSERDDWNRMAETLLLQQAKNRMTADLDDETERINNALDSENKSLRQRLSETQSRLQMLESELLRLRPLLLMQPLATHSLAVTPRPKHYQRKRRKDTYYSHAEDEDQVHAASGEEIDAPSASEALATPTNSLRSQTTPKSKLRRSNVSNQPSPSNHKRQSVKKASSALTTDARVEHLLLAARKLGKERAIIMSGIIRQIEERERERRCEDTASTAVEATPKTPKRVAPYPSYITQAGNTCFSSPVPPGPGAQSIPIFIPTDTPSLIRTPSSSTTAASATSPAHQPSKQSARTKNPQTPLDSLLSAARSMMHSNDVTNDQESKRRRSAPLLQEDDLSDSPLPKRRKLITTETTITSRETATSSANLALVDTIGRGSPSVAAGRIRSALDVLADQAAAFSSQEVSHRVPHQSQRKGKDKIGFLGTSKPPSTPREVVSSYRDTETRVSPFSVTSMVTSPSLGSTIPPLPFPRPEFISEVPADPGGTTTALSFQHTEAPQPLVISQDAITQELMVPRSSQISSVTPDQTAKLTPTPSLPMQLSVAQLQQSEFIPSVPLSCPSRVNSIAPTEKQETASVVTTREGSPLSPDGRQQYELTSAMGPGGGNGDTASSTPHVKAIVRVAGQVQPPQKRQRNPYVKWSKEEDELLAQAVAKYGQKWDLVQKALPSRGYHQVRQRWLRKLGVFDSRPDLSSFQTAGSMLSMGTASSDPPPNPKLGLAPLSSEIAFSSILSGRGGGKPSMPS